MNYEEKYEKALERARAIYQGKYKPEMAATIAETLQSIFPELAEPVESEDEKIRKDLINWVKTNMSYERMPVGMNYSNECVLAWLEKQGEKPVISDDALREGIAHFGITQYQIDNWLKKYVDAGE